MICYPVIMFSVSGSPYPITLYILPCPRILPSEWLTYLSERLRVTFAANDKRESVPRDQVSLQLSFTVHYNYTEIIRFTPVLSIRNDLQLAVSENLSIIYCLRDVGSELAFKIKPQKNYCQFTFNESCCVVLRTINQSTLFKQGKWLSKLVFRHAV